MNIGEINVEVKPDELYALLVKAVQSAPNIKIIRGNETSLKMRLSFLNDDMIESQYEVAIRFKGKYSVARITPVNAKDWDKLSSIQDVLAKGLTRYYTDSRIPKIDFRLSIQDPPQIQKHKKPFCDHF